MKVPTLEPLQVAPREAQLPARGVTPVTGNDALMRAGEEAGQAGQAIGEAYQKQLHQARVTKVNDGVTQYQRADTETFYGTSSGDPNAPVADVTKMNEEQFGSFLAGTPQQTPGFLATRGESALADVDSTLQQLEKRRQDIAEKIQDPDAKKMYLQQTATLYEASVRRAREHVAQQLEVAKVDSVKDNLAATLRQVALAPKDEALATELVAGAAGRAAALATSKEDADAKVEAIRGEVAKTRAESLLLAKDYDSAEKVVKGSELALGEEGKKLLSIIDERRAGAEVQDVATGIVKRATRPDGSLDERKIADDVLKVPADKRDKVAGAANEYGGLVKRAYDAETNKLLSRAMASYNTNGWWGMPPDLKNALNNRRDDDRGPNLYARLATAADEKAKRAKGSAAEQQRWQTQINRDALNDFKSLPTDVQAGLDLSPDGEFAQTHPDVDTHGWKAIGPHQKGATDVVTRGQSVQTDKFVESTTSALDKWLQPGKTPTEKLTRAKRLQDVKAEALTAFMDFRDKHKGAVPTVKEAEAMIGDIVKRHPPTNTEQAAISAAAIIKSVVPGPAAAPAGKKVKSYLVSPDGKRRVPVYADKTRGAEEPVP